MNGFIAFGPIPGCRGAASCRPPRSWPPGRRSGRVPALPYPPPKSLQSTPDPGLQTIHGWDAAAFPACAARLGRCQLPLPLRPDRLLTTGQFVCRRDVADRAVQAHRVGVRHELGDQSSSIVQAQGGLDADALSFQGLVSVTVREGTTFSGWWVPDRKPCVSVKWFPAGSLGSPVAGLYAGACRTPTRAELI